MHDQRLGPTNNLSVALIIDFSDSVGAHRRKSAKTIGSVHGDRCGKSLDGRVHTSVCISVNNSRMALIVR